MLILGKILDMINGWGTQLVDFVWGYFTKLPGSLQGVLVIFIAFLSIIGLIRLIHRSLKLVITLASIFIILIVLWLVFF